MSTTPFSIYEIEDDEFISCITSSHSWREALQKLNMKTVTRSIQRRVQNLQVDTSHFEKFWDGLYTKINRLSSQQINEVIQSSNSWDQVMNKFGYKSLAFCNQIKSKLDNLNINTSHLRDCKYNLRLIENSEVFVEDSDYVNGSNIKKRLQNDMGWERSCSSCKLKDWLGNPIPIQLDHINGNHFDNRIENLRFLCPNCHALTDTYCGKNMKIVRDRKQFENNINSNTSHESKSQKQKAQIQPKQCLHCDTHIAQHNTHCSKCDDKIKYESGINRKIPIRPSLEQLEEDMTIMSVVKVGQKYGVSDNCIRKWIKKYNKYEKEDKVDNTNNVVNDMVTEVT